MRLVNAILVGSCASEWRLILSPTKNMDKFLSRILPPLPPPEDTGLMPCYFMVGLTGEKKDLPDSHPFVSFNQIPSICQSMTGKNIYIAPASYKDSIFGRRGVNALHCKALWADIDVGKPQNSYDTLDDAVKALGNFVQKTQLKPTVVVHSGVGLQAYWTFDKPLEAAIWKQLARLFAAVCQQNNLILDPSRTQDVASILRMPGTLHLKSGNTARVIFDKGLDWNPKKLFELIKASLRDDPSLSAVPTNTAPPLQMPAQALSQTTLQQEPVAKAESIARGCPAILTAGLCAEPQWFAMMSVMKCCVDGHEWAHKLSAFDKVRYNPEDTEQKFAHASPNMPARCDTFAAMCAETCARCPNRGRITSPIQLGLGKGVATSKLVEAAPGAATPVSDHLVIPRKREYPLRKLESDTFIINEHGITYRALTKDRSGVFEWKDTHLCVAKLYYTHSVYSLENGAPRRTHWFVVEQPNGKREHVPFVVQKDMTPNNIMRWFNEANIFPSSSAAKSSLFMQLMNTYLQSVIGDCQEIATAKRFGWTTVQDTDNQCEIEGFATGCGVVTANGVKPVQYDGVAERIAREELGTTGSLEKWKLIPQMYRVLKQPAAQLAVCLAFAAPLMKYGSGIANNGIFSLWSSASGKGKSQVMRACASIWGHPDKQFIQRHSSSVLRMRKLSVIHNLPCYMDELTDVKDEDMYSLAYTLVDGREKQKLRTSGAEMVETGDWKTMTFTTANKSFKEAASKIAGDSDASVLRIMEMECDFQSYEHVPQVRDYIAYCISLCAENYGLAGPEFMYQLLRHADRLATLTRRVEAWCHAKGFAPEERYMAVPLGIGLIAGRWAVEWGLLDYDMDALEKWILEVFVPHNRGMTKENTVKNDDILRNYLLDRQLNILVVTDHDRPAEFQESTKGAPDKYIVVFPPREILVRYEQDTNTFYIAWHDFQAWCKKQNISAQVMASGYKRRGISSGRDVTNLARGISWMCIPDSQALHVSAVYLKNAAPQPR